MIVERKVSLVDVCLRLDVLALIQSSGSGVEAAITIVGRLCRAR